MNARGSAICDRVVEAGWLTAVLIIPLHLNPYTLRTFEADKTVLLRSIGLIMLLAWLIAWLEKRAGRTLWFLRWPALRSTPLVFKTTALFMAVYLLATATSVVPRASIWGSYSRLQGLYTTATYLTIFSLISLAMRSTAQLDRLIDTILLTSFPVALLAIMQQVGWSPVNWHGEDPTRAFSTLGNPVFLGAYLVMTIPLTALRALQAARQLRESPRPPPALAFAALVAVLLAVQLVALALTGSRGPLLALAGAMVLMALLWTVTRQQRRFVLSLLSASMITGVVLLVLFLQTQWLTPLADTPILQWLSSTRVTESLTIQSRFLIWESVINLIQADPGRMVIGYGPETIQEVLMPHVPPAFSHYEVASRQPDRAHNLVFDLLVTTGAAGLVAYLILFSGLVYLGLHSLGLIAGRAAKARFVCALLLGSLLGAAVPRLLFGSWIYAGLGLALGLVAGCIFYLLAVTFQKHPFVSTPDNHAGPAEPNRSLLIITLLTGLIAHFLDTNLGGIAVTASELYFWVYAGLLVALTSRPAPVTSNPAATTGHTGQASAAVHSWTTWGILAGLGLATLAFGVAPIQSFDPTIHNFSPVWFMVGTWLFFLAYLVASVKYTVPGQRAILRFAVWSLGRLAIFLALRTIILLTGGDAIPMLFGYLGFLIAGWGVAASFLGSRGEFSSAPPPLCSPNARSRGSSSGLETESLPHDRALPAPLPVRTALYVLLGLLVGGVIKWTNLAPVEADIYAQAAGVYAVSQQWNESFFLYGRALALAPEEQTYLTRLAKAYVERALSADPSQRAAWFDRAQATLVQARALNPRHPDHAFNLAHLYLLWAQATSDRAQQTLLLDRALAAFQTAAEMVPRSPEIYNEWAVAYQLQGNFDQALSLYRRSLDLDPRLGRTYLLLGRLYVSGGRTGEALDMLEQARRLDPKSVEVYLALSEVYLDEGLAENALDAAQRAVDIAPENYLSHERLARLYERLGQPNAALAEAQTALNYAPADARPGLRQFIQDLQARRP